MSRREFASRQPHKGRICGDCYWLNNSFEGQTCADVGQMDKSEACKAFEYREPNEWIKKTEAVISLTEDLRKKELRVPRLVQSEVEEVVRFVGGFEIPRIVKTPAQGRKLQVKIADTVAYRSRMTELVYQLASLRVALIIRRTMVETELLVLGPVRQLKTKHERDLVLSVGCEAVDSRILKVDSLIDSCREIIKACDAARNAADIVIRAIYATKDTA